MKKISILLLVALAMIACGNGHKSAQAEQMVANDSTYVVTLENEADSINYAVGFINATQIKMYYLNGECNDEMVIDFLSTLEQAYNDEFEEETNIAKTGKQIGYFIKTMQTKGVANRSEWAVNEPIFLQAMINGIYRDTTGMALPVAESFFMNAYQSGAMGNGEQPVFGDCPSEVAQVDLHTFNDSINYAFGLLNGSQLASMLEMEEDFDAALESLLSNMETYRVSATYNPQLLDIAANIGNTVREQEETGLINIKGMETNMELIERGFIHGFKDKTIFFDDATANEYISSVAMHYHQLEMEKQQAEMEAKGAEAKAAGEAFLADNAKREGVKVTASGLQYEVITMGEGPKPTAEQTVKVHYEGTLIDGTVFDSSYERGEPISFPLNGVISGWTEGLQLMPVGSKYKFFIPYQLAYGEHGAGQDIPPYAALIFTVELLGIEE